MYDPTREEMLTFLAAHQAEEFDVEEAIYWFANDYHSGQWTNLYQALCASPYTPGPITNTPSEGMACELYAELVAEFVPVKEDCQ